MVYLDDQDQEIEITSSLLEDWTCLLDQLSERGSRFFAVIIIYKTLHKIFQFIGIVLLLDFVRKYLQKIHYSEKDPMIYLVHI